jgi:adenylate cyclase
MISEYTYNVVKNEVVVRELDYIRVKGKKKPTRVYELIGLEDDEEAVKKYDDLKNYFKGLRLYQDADFVEAKKIFTKSAELLPDDGPSKLYVDRCEYYIENPPGKDWNRVFVMKTK